MSKVSAAARRTAPGLATGLAVALCACAAQGQPDTPTPAPVISLPPVAPAPAVAAPPPSSALRPLASLPGWAQEDHLAALKAFQAGCGAARAPEWKAVCVRARGALALDDATARTFFETNFSAEPPSPTGMLTAYFSPEYPAQDEPDEIFSAPVRPRPPDSADDPRLGAPRAEIESEPAVGAKAFMKAEDLFFLQIQGSGVLVFPDGRRMKAVYAGDNGQPFTAIARPMLRAGLLPADRLSGDAIRGWLSDPRGTEADAVMDKNTRYIFFDLVPDDGREPAGAAGIPLTAGRAIAVDPSFHRYGALYWVDADAPTLRGAVPAYRRLALALDTGAAIRGERRADLYIGRGDEAGREAGRVKHVLNLVRLIPTPPIDSAPHETPAPAGGS
jgi:membrane-bound lytic murein transglycosylase A